MSEAVPRVLWQPGGPRDHFVCSLELIAQRRGCRYERCRCGSRKVTIQPGARPEASWVTQGILSGQVVSIRQATIFEMGRAA
jgi:hypothetical protein